MITQLLPLLASANLIFSLSAADGGRVRVTVMAKVKSGATPIPPLVAEDTPEALDAELPALLVAYTGKVAGLVSNCSDLDKQIKEIEDKKKEELKKKTANAASKPAAIKPATATTPVKAPPAEPDLFSVDAAAPSVEVESEGEQVEEESAVAA